MRLKRFFWIASTTVLLIVSQTFRISFLAPFAASPVVAQSSDARKAEADQLFQQGVQQHRNSQFQDALQSFQQALVIYREIEERKGEALTLGILGRYYISQGNLPRAIEFFDQSLAIAREINDPELEKLVLQDLSLAKAQNNSRKADANRLLQQGGQQYQTREFQAAIQSFQQALALYQGLGDRQGEGNVLEGLGIVYGYGSLGDYAKSIVYLQQSLAIFREIGDRKGEVRTLGNLGIAYGSQGDFSRAIEFFEQGLAIAREINDPELEKLVLQNLSLAQDKNNPRKAEAKRIFEQGGQQFQTNQFKSALQSWQQALTIYREIGDRQGEANALNNLGTAYDALYDYAQSIEYYQQSLAIFREIGDRQGEAETLKNLGIAYNSLDNYTKSIEYHQQSLTIARSIGDRQKEANALGNLGKAHNSLRNYAKAIEYLEQSLVIFREIGDRKGEGAAFGNLGNTYNSLDNYAKAIEYHQQHLAIAREMGNRRGEAAALSSLGNAYDNLSDYAKAIEYHQQRLAIAREMGDRKGEGAACGNLGNAYYSLGDYAKSIEYHHQSLTIAQSIGARQTEANALANLGLVYALGDYAQAIDYHQQSLKIMREIGDRSGEGGVLGRLGLVYNALGDYAKAIEYHQQNLAIAREIGDRKGEGAALSSLGVAYDNLGDYAQAIEYHKQGLAIAREIGQLDAEGTNLNNLGVALFNSGNLPEAERVLSAGIEKKEKIREKLGSNDAWKVSIFEEQARSYLLLQQVLIAQNKTDQALETAERGRARAFVELLARNLSAQSETPPPIKPPSLEDIKKIAQQQNATIVEYSIFDFKNADKSELFIWVVSPNGEVTFRQHDLKSLGTGATTKGSLLRKLVAQTLESLGVGEDRNGIFEVTATNSTADPQRQTKSLKQLYQLLIQPIANLLPSDPEERVIFIPHEDLFRVPFPALIGSDGKYLVEKHTILTAPSIQVLELTRKQRQNVSRSGQGALVVGNPSPMPKGFQPLQGAEKEALEVAQLLKTKPIIGSQATEPAVLQQLPNARIIHLATHGTFNEQQPLLGGVALAQTGKDTQNDGLLTAEEIFNLKSKLSAELLVLSACNTGRGRITGDGVIGLSRSFIAAGIPSVIVSLWSVPDAPTAELMSEFYTNLYQKKLDKAQALRMAMLKMMEKHRDNPRTWAAFTLIGEAE